MNIDELKLWPHQRAAIDTCDRYFAAGIERSALIHLPTGTGKTGVMATVSAQRAHEKPVLVICPSAALVTQLEQDFRSRFWSKIAADGAWAPEKMHKLLPSGIDAVLETIERVEEGRVVIFSTIQALQQIYTGDRYGELVGKFGTVLFDEGHR